MKQSSPGQIEGTAIREITTSLRDVLSVGKQIEDIRLAGIRVAEAKLAFERKQLEFEEAKREEALRSDLQQLNLEVEKAKKGLELQRLRTQLNEEQVKQKRLIRDDLDERFKILSQSLKVLGQLPKELQSDVRAGLQLEVERLQDLPFEFTEIELQRIKE